MTNLLFSHPPPPLVDAILRDDVLISFIAPPEFQTEPIYVLFLTNKPKSRQEATRSLLLAHYIMRHYRIKQKKPLNYLSGLW